MNFWRLVSPEHFANTPIVGDHAHILCLFASLLAVLAALVLLPVAQRYHYGNPAHRYAWLIAGSVGMGAGIWAMHFTAMLAYSLPFEVSYDLPITLMSILPAMIASGGCIALYQPDKTSYKKQLLAALILALGVGGMHYLGMEALVVPADMFYRPNLFILSLIVGYTLSALGLSAHQFLFRSPKVSTTVGVVLGSVFIGAAVSATHFVAMEATYFQASWVEIVRNITIPSYTLVVLIATVTVTLLGIILMGTLLDKKMDAVTSSLKNSEHRFQSLAGSTQSAIFTFDRNRIYYANPALEDITGYSIEALTGHPIQKLFGDKFNELIEAFLYSGEACIQECQIVTAEKKAKWLYFSLTPAEFSDQPLALGSAIDVTDQKQAELTLLRMAYTDQLTGLANRARLLDSLNHHLALIERRDDEPNSCLVMLDLNKFKDVNDTLGHQQGDLVLKRLSLRLRHFCREADTPARLGGDEFIVLFEDMHSSSNIKNIINRLIRHLCRPIELGEGVIDIQVSIGVLELTPGRYKTADEALKDVDIALYRAKARGDTNWVLFDDLLDLGAKRQRVLQGELKEAIQNQSLELYFQPIVDVIENRILGFESLSRWQRRDGERVLPQEFIALAEAMGIVSEIGLWATELAARQLAEWNDVLGHKKLYVSVNLAPVSFIDERLYTLLEKVIEQYSLQPQQIKLELTESMLMSDTEIMLERLHLLKAMGCDIVIDDFGTGYSSLSYLHRFPAAVLKIDRSFVNELDGGGSAISIVRTIAGLADNLNMSVICEGVETEFQEQCLVDLGCSVFQGNLYGKPMPKAEASQFLSANYGALQKAVSSLK